MYNAKDLSVFPPINDDLISEESEDVRRDLILANLTNQQVEPNADLMALYHFPVYPNDNVNDTNSDKLNEISSNDSENQSSSEISDDEEELEIWDKKQLLKSI